MARTNFLTTCSNNFDTIGMSADMLKDRVYFWTHANLANIERRIDVISSARSATADFSVPSGRNNKKALDSANEKALYNKALEDTKKRTFKRSKLFKPEKKIVRASLYSTGLFHNSLFDVYELEHKIVMAINDELNNDSERVQYIAFWTECKLDKVYKRARLETTLRQEATREAIKARNNATIECDNNFYVIPSVDKVIPEATNIQYCNNDFMNYALNNHLAERLVYTKLFALYRGSVNKKTGELKGGNLDALRLINNVNMPTSKEDLVQALNLHFWECALCGDYYIDEDETPIFDIMACFRVVGNMMYASGNNHGKYKLIHSDNEDEAMLDSSYTDKAIDSINECFWYEMQAHMKTITGKHLKPELLDNIRTICGGIISGYRYKAIASSLELTEHNVKKIVERYIKPFLTWYAIDTHLLYRECKEAHKKTVNDITSNDIYSKYWKA